MPAIAIQGLGVDYGTTEAIRGLDLTVETGEFVAVLGPSGCGKSTLLRVLMGLTDATAGTVDLAGRASYVPQGDSCFPWLTAEENVSYGLRLRGVGRGQRKQVARQLLGDLGLEGFAKRYPATLSEGMRQRVSIARAFAFDAPALLMDEPLSALDFQTRIQVQEELLRLWAARDCAILYVTHDIDEALALADRVVVLTARPARVAGEVIPPFDRPRSYRDIRTHPAYADTFANVYQLLEGGSR